LREEGAAGGGAAADASEDWATSDAKARRATTGKGWVCVGICCSKDEIPRGQRPAALRRFLESMSEWERLTWADSPTLQKLSARRPKFPRQCLCFRVQGLPFPFELASLVQCPCSPTLSSMKVRPRSGPVLCPGMSVSPPPHLSQTYTHRTGLSTRRAHNGRGARPHQASRSSAEVQSRVCVRCGRKHVRSALPLAPQEASAGRYHAMPPRPHRRCSRGCAPCLVSLFSLLNIVQTTKRGSRYSPARQSPTPICPMGPCSSALLEPGSSHQTLTPSRN